MNLGETIKYCIDCDYCKEVISDNQPNDFICRNILCGADLVTGLPLNNTCMYNRELEQSCGIGAFYFTKKLTSQK